MAPYDWKIIPPTPYEGFEEGKPSLTLSKNLADMLRIA